MERHAAGPRSGRRPLIAPLWLILAYALLVACPATEEPPAEEEPTTLGDCPIYEPLEQPPTLSAIGDGETLSSSLVVRMIEHTDVPVVTAVDNNQATDCELRDMELRTYGYPGTSGELDFITPGPTLRVNKTYLQDTAQEPDPGTNPVTRKGSQLVLELINELPNNSFPAHDCEPASYQACEDDPTTECKLEDGIWTCPDDPDQSCVETPVPQETPNCNHGADVTNLHFHGSHFSPQPHQDFVLLELFSSAQVDPPPPAPNGFDVAVGSYNIDVPQVPWNQPPGTHWYHPHKHGSTALQVGNGMAGALLIEGPFDDWLYGYYDVDPRDPASLEVFEKVLVVHQAKQTVPFYTNPLPPEDPPYPLVNGQLIPKVSMRYGEVQRWRFIAATMNAAAQLAISFPDGFDVKQIAQDGVQFAPENYQRQPFDASGTWNLSPGNRIDFLVQAPDAPASAEETATPRLFHVNQQVIGRLGQLPRQKVINRAGRLRTRLGVQVSSAIADDPFVEPLFAIEVSGTEPMDLPAESDWPPIPYYLRDIDEFDGERTVAYSMTDPETGRQTPIAGQPNGFWINETQFDGSCANITGEVGSAEQWRVTNDNGLSHPHHIHTNPFQILSNAETTYDAPYPWMDTIGLPTPTDDDPLPSVVLRQRYEDYSGAFVIHCHFLGHEDRGMMLLVQTVCPGEIDFGTPLGDGLPDDCAIPSELYPAEFNPFPACAP